MRLYMARKRPDNAVVSQRRAALAAGVSHGTWQNWEQGKSEPRVSQLHRIAAFLGVDEGWLLTGQRRRPPVAPDPSPSREAPPTVTNVRSRRLISVPTARCPERSVTDRQPPLMLAGA